MYILNNNNNNVDDNIACVCLRGRSAVARDVGAAAGAAGHGSRCRRVTRRRRTVPRLRLNPPPPSRERDDVGVALLATHLTTPRQIEIRCRRLDDSDSRVQRLEN